jgi:hypothetical protein
MLDSQQFGLVFIGRGAFSFSSPRPTSPHFGLPLTYFGHPEKRLLCRLLRTPKGSNSKTLGPRTQLCRIRYPSCPNLCRTNTGNYPPEQPLVLPLRMKTERKNAMPCTLPYGTPRDRSNEPSGTTSEYEKINDDNPKTMPLFAVTRVETLPIRFLIALISLQLCRYRIGK